MFTTRRQDDWVDLLPLAEFAYNNASHAATGFSPFYATYGYHPAFSFVTPSVSTVPVAEERVKHLQHIYEELRTMIDIAGQQAKRRYNQGVTKQPLFQIGDKILLRYQNIVTTAPSQKLASKFLRPFPIMEKLSDVVYHVKLPRTLRIHNVFHVSLLERYHEDTIPGRQQDPPPPIITPDGHIEWEVHQILDSRLYGR